MAELAERDRYLFGNLESSANNRAKVREVNYGFDQPEGVFLTTLDFAVNWIRIRTWPGGWISRSFPCASSTRAFIISTLAFVRWKAAGFSIIRRPLMPIPTA